MGPQRACSANEQIDVVQAGDQFVNFVLDEIETACRHLPKITREAEVATDRIVRKDVRAALSW